MECLHITGETPLRGTIVVNGAKNAALPLLTLGLLTDQSLLLRHVPSLTDVASMLQLLGDLGTQIDHDPLAQTVTLSTQTPFTLHASYDVVRKMRASILVLGGLLGRWGQARVSLPGGCAIGVRPLNLHLEGLRALGAHIDIDNGDVVARNPNGSRLPGGRYTFSKSTVTGTQNVLFAAVLAKGESCLLNVAQEPEITDVIVCLRKMGAVIEGQGTSTLHIQGVEQLMGAQHTVMSDRIELGTFMAAAAMTNGDLILENADIGLLPTVMPLLETMGVHVIPLDERRVRVTKHQGPLRAFSCVTQAYPGFPTDLQAQFMAMATVAEGTSRITETIWENRFMHVNEMARMGARIDMDGHTALVHGVSCLKGAHVMATDLRASVSLVLAGMAAKGITKVLRIYHLDRGYERIEERLNACGAQITRQPYADDDTHMTVPMVSPDIRV